MLYHYSDYMKLGDKCKQMTSTGTMINAIIVDSRYKIICPGCAWYNDGKCSGYIELREQDDGYINRIERFSNEKSTKFYTNGELAAKLGITKRQVSKLRKEGKLDMQRSHG